MLGDSNFSPSDDFSCPAVSRMWRAAESRETQKFVLSDRKNFPVHATPNGGEARGNPDGAMGMNEQLGVSSRGISPLEAFRD
jgi:hypothetical protein